MLLAKLNLFERKNQENDNIVTGRRSHWIQRIGEVMKSRVITMQGVNSMYR